MPSLIDQYHPEGLHRAYPYGAAMGNDYVATGCSRITLFSGEDYGVGFGAEEYDVKTAAGRLITVPYGGLIDVHGFSPYGVPVGFGAGELYYIHGDAFGWDLFKSVGHFVSNAVKSAGRAIGHVAHAIQDAAGKISKEIAKIPIVGGALKVIFDAVYHSTMGLINMTVSIVIEGKRIDKVIMDHLKTALQDFKQVAPYAQMVISLVPGIGPGVSAALSAGLALAEGQPLVEVLKAGLIGALPGGPLVKAAVTMGVETIQHVARGDKLDFATLAQTAGGIASSALGLPMVAKNALMGGLSIVGGIASGKPLDKAITDGAIKALPIPDAAKGALTEATALTMDLAHGKRVDQALMNRMNGVANLLPIGNPLKDTIKTATGAVKNLAQGKNVEQVVMGAMQSGLGDTLVSMGAQALPRDVQQAIKSGVAMGTGVVDQVKHADQLVHKVTGKLIESGVQLAHTAPVFAEARKIAGSAGSHGFDLGAGLLQQQAGIFAVATVRNSLPNPADKKGFDIAISARIGAVANPKPPTLSAAAHAGHVITMGMQSYEPAKKAEIMKAVVAVPSAAVGATLATKEIATVREGWLRRLLKALGLAH